MCAAAQQFCRGLGIFDILKLSPIYPQFWNLELTASSERVNIPRYTIVGIYQMEGVVWISILRAFI